MIKHLFLDMDGTSFDFEGGNLKRALLLMSNPAYYIGLPLIYPNLGELIKKVQAKGVKVHIISGIADYKASPKYISHENYEDYFFKVCSVKTREIEKTFPDIHFESIDFVMQSDSKAEYVKRKYGYNLSECLLVDDFSRYVEEWRKLGGQAYLVTDRTTVKEVLEAFINSPNVQVNVPFNRVIEIIDMTSKGCVGTFSEVIRLFSEDLKSNLKELVK